MLRAYLIAFILGLLASELTAQECANGRCPIPMRQVAASRVVIRQVVRPLPLVSTPAPAAAQTVHATSAVGRVVCSAKRPAYRSWGARRVRCVRRVWWRRCH